MASSVSRDKHAVSYMAISPAQTSSEVTLSHFDGSFLPTAEQGSSAMSGPAGHRLLRQLALSLSRCGVWCSSRVLRRGCLPAVGAHTNRQPSFHGSKTIAPDYGTARTGGDGWTSVLGGARVKPRRALRLTSPT